MILTWVRIGNRASKVLQLSSGGWEERLMGRNVPGGDIPYPRLDDLFAGAKSMTATVAARACNLRKSHHKTRGRKINNSASVTEKLPVVTKRQRRSLIADLRQVPVTSFPVVGGVRTAVARCTAAVA